MNNRNEGVIIKVSVEKPATTHTIYRYGQPELKH